MKVLLLKSTEDMNWGGDDYDIISLNPISKALTDCQSHKQGFDRLLSASVVAFTVKSDAVKAIRNSKTTVPQS